MTTDPDTLEVRSDNDCLAKTTSISPETGELPEFTRQIVAGGRTAGDRLISKSLSAPLQATSGGTEVDAETSQQLSAIQISVDDDSEVHNKIAELTRNMGAFVQKVSIARGAVSALERGYELRYAKQKEGDFDVVCMSSWIAYSLLHLENLDKVAERQLSWMKEGSECLEIRVNENQPTSQMDGDLNSDAEYGKTLHVIQARNPTGTADNTLDDNGVALRTAIGTRSRILLHEQHQRSNIAQRVRTFGGQECKVLPTLLSELRHWDFSGSLDSETTEAALRAFEKRYGSFCNRTAHDPGEDWPGPQLGESYNVLREIITACSEQRSCIYKAIETFVPPEDRITEEDSHIRWLSRIEVEFHPTEGFGVIIL